MIFKFFLLGNLLYLCMKIINLVVLVGFYYGFLIIFFIGFFYFFFFWVWVMEEGIEKEVLVIIGFIMG